MAFPDDPSPPRSTGVWNDTWERFDTEQLPAKDED